MNNRSPLNRAQRNDTLRDDAFALHSEAVAGLPSLQRERTAEGVRARFPRALPLLTPSAEFHERPIQTSPELPNGQQTSLSALTEPRPAAFWSLLAHAGLAAGLWVAQEAAFARVPATPAPLISVSIIQPAQTDSGPLPANHPPLAHSIPSAAPSLPEKPALLAPPPPEAPPVPVPSIPVPPVPAPTIPLAAPEPAQPDIPAKTEPVAETPAPAPELPKPEPAKPEPAKPDMPETARAEAPPAEIISPPKAPPPEPPRAAPEKPTPEKQPAEKPAPVKPAPVKQTPAKPALVKPAPAKPAPAPPPSASPSHPPLPPAEPAAQPASTNDAAPSQAQAPAPASAPAASPPAASGLRDVLLKEARFLGQPRPPVYPRRARELEQQGTVVLHIRLDGQGSIVDVQVQTSSGFALLDEAALAAARNWRFQPPTRDGLPIDGGIVAVPVPFTLR